MTFAYVEPSGQAHLVSEEQAYRPLDTIFFGHYVVPARCGREVIESKQVDAKKVDQSCRCQECFEGTRLWS